MNQTAHYEELLYQDPTVAVLLFLCILVSVCLLSRCLVCVCLLRAEALD